MNMLVKLINILKKNYKVLAVLAIVLAVGLYFKNSSSASDMSDAANLSAEEAQKITNELVADVKKLMVLPEDEQPAVFDVKDPEMLAKQQAFFIGAQSGDKLMVYQKASKAIIYSPERNLIVNVGPINFDAPAEAATTTSNKK